MQTPGGIAACAALLDDDSALLVDLLRVVGHEMGIIVKDEEAGVDDGLTDKRNVVQHVLGLLHSGGSIDIAAEGGADALEPVEDPLAGEILGTVEAHVLEEMCQTVLVRSLLDSTDIGGEIELCTLLRLVVMTDIVGKSVVKLALTDSRIVGKRLHLLRSCKRHGRKQKGGKQNKSFHVQSN